MPLLMSEFPKQSATCFTSKRKAFQKKAREVAARAGASFRCTGPASEWICAACTPSMLLVCMMRSVLCSFLPCALTLTLLCCTVLAMGRYKSIGMPRPKKAIAKVSQSSPLSRMRSKIVGESGPSASEAPVQPREPVLAQQTVQDDWEAEKRERLTWWKVKFLKAKAHKMRTRRKYKALLQRIVERPSINAVRDRERKIAACDAVLSAVQKATSAELEYVRCDRNDLRVDVAELQAANARLKAANARLEVDFMQLLSAFQCLKATYDRLHVLRSLE